MTVSVLSVNFTHFFWVTSYKCVLFSFHLHTSLSQLLLTVCDGCTCVRAVMLPVVHWCGAEVRSSTDTLSLHYLSGCRSEALVKLFTHLTCIGSVGLCHSCVHVWPLTYTYTHTNSYLSMIDWRFCLVIVYLPGAIDLIELDGSLLIHGVIGKLLKKKKKKTGLMGMDRRLKTNMKFSQNLSNQSNSCWLVTVPLSEWLYLTHKDSHFCLFVKLCSSVSHCFYLCQRI